MLGLEQSLAEIGQYREIIGLASARASAIQGSLNVLSDLSVDLQFNGQTALDTRLDTASRAISVSARQALDSAISALNVSFSGRRLFAGDAGDTPALATANAFMSAAVPILEAGPAAGAAYANLSAAFNTAGGLYETTLYTGGTGDAPATEVALGERLDFAPRADEAPIRALLQDLTTLAAAFDTDNAIAADERRGLAGLAIAGLRNIIGALADMASRVGVAEQRIETILTRHQASETAMTLTYNRLAGRDQFEAAAELTQLETQLEAAYLVTTRMGNLSLVNFLR